MAGTTADIARWTGAAGDGDPTNAANWIAQAGTPSTPPTDDEKALFDHRGAGNVNGVDMSGVALGELEIRGFPGQIGTNGAPLQISASVLKINTEGRVALSGTFTTTRIDAGARVYLVSGDCNNMTISGGVVLIGESFTVAKDSSEKVLVLGGEVTINANANAIVELEQQGGTVKTFRSVTTLGAKGGFTYTLNAAAVTAATVEGGATYYLLSSGTVTTMNLRRGTLTNVGTPFGATITTLNHYQTTGVKNLDMGQVTVGTENPIGAPGGSTGFGA